MVFPEILLSLAVYHADRGCAGQGWWPRIIAAPLVAILYAGALALSWLFVEGP